MIGTAIANYEITKEIGRGGMGIVYLARDTKLDRDVAIKVLSEDLIQDPEFLARFEREAKLLATLHHPNLAAVYGLEVVDGQRYLVLEYIEGEDLAEILMRGAVPVDEALPIARQIAEGVEEAHAKGIIHRDLKPGNIKITPDGTAKVLDFGLAKAMHTEASTASGLITSPTVVTLTSPTNASVILGTAGYVSPEQARGKTVDRRTDIWSFGCILFEMLSGKKVFSGETATDSLGAVMHKEPEWTALPAETPATVQLLLRRCLSKDRKKRLQDIGDARIELEEVIADPTASSLNLAGAALAAGASRPAWRTALPWVLTVTFAVALVGGWLTTRVDTAPGPVRKFTLTIAEEQAIPPFVRGPFDISSDGRRFVFVGPGTPFTSLYLRHLDQLGAHAIPNTDGAWLPFFSPDGQWIAYGNDDKLMRISARGGPPSTLCDAPSFRGGVWGLDGTIILAPDRAGGLVRVLAAGGTPEPLTTVDEKDTVTSHRHPFLLPEGRGVLFSATGRDDDWEEVAVMVWSAETGEQKVLIQGGTDGRYVPTGHLVYRRESTIMAAPFDLDRLEVTGPSVPVLEGVAGGNSGSPAQLSYSDDGTMVYMPGSDTEERKLVWLDHKGFQEPLSEQRGEFRSYALSPDNDRVAITVHEDSDDDIWILQRQRDILRPLTFDPADDRAPVWGPDGRWIVFASDRESEDDVTSLFRISADFTGTPQRLTTAEFPQTPESVSPDGSTVVYMEVHPEREGDLYMLRLDEDGNAAGEPEVLTNRPIWEWAAEFSPDGRWILYGSNVSGTGQVYVQSLDGGGAPVQVSTEGGFRGRWSPAENRVFYTTFKKLFSAPYTVENGTFTPGDPEPLFALEAGIAFWNFRVSADGQRFSWLTPADEDSQGDQPVVVLNWFEELRERLPSQH